MSHKIRPPRINAGGNFCGHSPNNPRIALTEEVKKGRGGLPGILTKLMERSVAYYDQPWRLPSLNYASGSGHQQRSERREACLSVLWAILKHTDLATLKVGIPGKGGHFVNLTVSYLARLTGLPQRRSERAFAALIHAGIVSTSKRCEKMAEGRYKGMAAIKRVSPHIFGAFGLKARLKYERNKAQKRLTRKTRRERSPSGSNARARMSLGAKPLASPSYRATPDAGDDHSMEKRRQLLELQYEIKQARPELGSGAVRQLAIEVLEARWRRR